MRVLAMGAHPDDVELFCAGTLAHYVRQGAHVTVAVLTNGELGSRTLSPEETAVVREKEALRAAGVLGAELLWTGAPDGFLFDTPEVRRQAVDVVRRSRPDVIFAHHPGDYHPDHRMVAQLASAARLLARETSLVSSYPATDRVAPLFYMDTLLGTGGGSPDVWVDISDTMGTKEAMLAEHLSQNDARRRRKGADFVDLTKQQAAFRGQQVGVRHAEVFTCAPSHPATSALDLVPEGAEVRLPVCASPR
ncbi:PIG-L deacetylase family protein [Streptomyces pinistramenti]|uniref:PIG-L deacetylase family protein n=1 Tax=Streptomyces pinistramenti TaxID=2884812 RepID=UPI001D06F660|nr:PIG-L family deacetylase [Streptomyces pinistramenti]MCB5906934.1 PIG-L family deacetylase [Streptomyces pinistramenti]